MYHLFCIKSVLHIALQLGFGVVFVFVFWGFFHLKICLGHLFMSVRVDHFFLVTVQYSVT